MIVFVEGVDGSGKTTLVNKLVTTYGYERLPLPPRHKLKTLENSEWKMLFAHINNCPDKDKIYICDRSVLTEIVYRLTTSPEKSFIDNHLLIKLLSTPISFIYCHTKTSFEDAKKRGETNITDEKLHNRITNGYIIAFDFITKFTNVSVFNYNWQFGNEERVVNFINNLKGGK